ncbi:hypothetical protein ASPSYDRAFT_50773 [Aspergillus sydowii CBS 593.65]|uniref:Uncharacterized protein n=1 Tax=Aspergillus sydowii CBS 593.65 TaxID=1036612 RepID=A0A1L9T3Y2_9EURO|nr:uncharacterized protein ASPSYDRAFT_50773 [Aspergillus sydowii CBS 593.65]OJJ54003.1 hypothetical protein ASPSYDRAFT_50773 [Aspergillus sydowii CBS 593.65]
MGRDIRGICGKIDNVSPTSWCCEDGPSITRWRGKSQPHHGSSLSCYKDPPFLKQHRKPRAMQSVDEKTPVPGCIGLYELLS